MKETLYAALEPVRSRQQTALVLRTTLLGLVAGAVGGLILGLIRLISGSPLGWVLPAAVVLGLPAAGLFAGVVLRRRYRDAASAIDEHYQLKDRSVTALEFLSRSEPTDLHQLQISDALEHVRRVEPDKVAPIQAPRGLTAAAAGSLVIAAALLLWPLRVPEAEAAPLPAPAHILAEAEKVQESLQDLEDEAEREKDPELAKLVMELKKKVEEMKQPGVDEREALAKLSEMQAAIQAQMAQYNPAVVDGQMQSLGNALASAAAFEGAGKALQEAKLEKAAQELEKVEDPKLERKEAKVLEEKLKQVAKEAGDAGLGSLSTAVADVAENLKGGKSATGKATRALAKEVNREARRRRVNDLLRGELDELKEAKCNCQSNSLVTGKKPEKSTSPSSTFGMTTSGNTQGDKTKLLSQRNQMELTGTPGEGPSDIETTASPEARQQAARAYREKYQKYRKESEAVLDSEPIPLGQRQMIRKYFELIRPQNVDAAVEKK